MNFCLGEALFRLQTIALPAFKKLIVCLKIVRPLIRNGCLFAYSEFQRKGGYNLAVDLAWVPAM
jgi:hypothetical protein